MTIERAVIDMTKATDQELACLIACLRLFGPEVRDLITDEANRRDSQADGTK